MSSKKLEAKTHQTIDAYIRLLDNYSFEQLIQQPDENSWSIGQVYVHVWMASKGFFFKNAALCLSGETAEKGKSKKLIAYPIFLFEKMPTVKIKMPDKVAVQPRQPESKEQLAQKLTEIKALVSEFVQKIPQSDSTLKTKHPFLGYLNCAEWVKLCNIHFKHHRSQIDRINKALHF
jgi:uncharacterized damage-inducible protein DinB